MLSSATLCALLVLAPTQLAPQPRTPALDASDDVHRRARIAHTGTLGLPALPPLRADSPRDAIVWADRVPVGQTTLAAATAPVPMLDGHLPAGPTGTGTVYPEIFKYQLPADYDQAGPLRPLLVAYHGFGGSANSPAANSTLDEECNLRGWIYMAPTGLDDQLFGPPQSQQHTEAAVRWMLDNTRADPDRVYMVGFSMGGGVVANFAARHRDPAGLMIAAIGSVGATLDWTLSYTLGPNAVRTLMEHEANFGGTPAVRPFRYRQASALHFHESSYPPVPGVLDPALSMASGLGSVPAYVTWDTGDTIPEVRPSNEAFVDLLQAQGTPLRTRVVSGTTSPQSGQPAPHSWAVLDVADLLDFFDGLQVQRRPPDFVARQDLGGAVAWVTTTQDEPEIFTSIAGRAVPAAGRLFLEQVQNAERVEVDVGAAGLAGTWPLRVTATSLDDDGLRLVLKGFDTRPSYLLHALGNVFVTQVDADPLADALLVDVPAHGTLDVRVVRHPAWTGSLRSDPNPVAPGASTDILVDLPETSLRAYVIVAVHETLYGVKGVKLTALAAPPALILNVPLAGGNRTLHAAIPADPNLSGARLHLQALGLDAGNKADSVTNPWGFRID